MLRFLGLDKAIVYSFVLKTWQAFAGLIGLILITQYCSSDVQGFYYTFISLVALQSFVELGLYIVIASIASHEWAELKLGMNGQITGNPAALSRLISLGRFIFKWYAVAALIFFSLSSVGGYWLFAQSQIVNVDWKLPWFIYVAFSSVWLWCMPFLSLLEACGQVDRVAVFRFWQTFASSICSWVAIAGHHDLWALPVLVMVSVISCLYYLLVTKRTFFRPFFNSPSLDSIRWCTEIFPMQWRLALQGLMNYFSFSVFTPVMFYHYGPKVAGQMGMTQQILMAMLSIALIWVTTKAPQFGILVARREFQKLDIEWRRATQISVSLVLVGAFLFTAALVLSALLHLDPTDRLLPLLPSLFLAIATVFVAVVQCIAVYLRAHKKEILTAPGVLTGALTGLMVWKLGAAFGPVGATASYLFVTAFLALPMTVVVFRKSRHEWHIL